MLVFLFKRKLNKYLGLSFGIISFIVFVIIFLSSSYSDGGSLLAYNLLFFYPMILFVGFFSLVSILISVIRLIKKKSNNNWLNAVSILLATPGLLYVILIIVSLFQFVDIIEDAIRVEQVYNNVVDVDLADKTIFLTGFNYGNSYERRRVYISGIPFYDKNFRKVDALFCQGDSTFDILYLHKLDSIILYIPKGEPLYHDVNGKDYLMPVRAIMLSDEEFDSLRDLKSNKVKEFEWK